MKYRFLIVGYDNEYHSVEKEFSTYGDALTQVRLFLSDVDSVKSIDLYKLKSDYSCGTVKWVGLFDMNTVLIPTGMLDEIKGY